jgi:hypothetical protein
LYCLFRKAYAPSLIALPTSTVLGPPGLIFPIRYISNRDARTATTPAMGAIQKTSGLLDNNDANACKGNMFDTHAHFAYIFFLDFQDLFDVFSIKLT